MDIKTEVTTTSRFAGNAARTTPLICVFARRRHQYLYFQFLSSRRRQHHSLTLATLRWEPEPHFCCLVNSNLLLFRKDALLHA